MKVYDVVMLKRKKPAKAVVILATKQELLYLVRGSNPK